MLCITTFTLQSVLFENVYLVYLRAYSGMEISKDEQDLFSDREKQRTNKNKTNAVKEVD